GHALLEAELGERVRRRRARWREVRQRSAGHAALQRGTDLAERELRAESALLLPGRSGGTQRKRGGEHSWNDLPQCVDRQPPASGFARQRAAAVTSGAYLSDVKRLAGGATGAPASRR